MIAVAEVHELVGRWWFTYDAAGFDELRSLLTDDATFTCRTDTGNAEWEEFLHAWWVQPGRLLAGEYPGASD